MSEKDFERVMTNAFYGTVSNIANEVFEERGVKEGMESKVKRNYQWAITLQCFSR